MTVGTKALRKIQLGKETTAGTPVTATTIWRGVGVLDDQRETVFVEEDVGQLMGVSRNYTPTLLAGLSLEEIPATFEQLGHILNAGVKAITTAAADGTGSGQVWEFTLPTTAANSIKTYTIEGGDDVAQERAEYAFVKKFSLAGKAGEALKMSADWAGRQISTMAAFSTAATLPEVETILVGNGRVYLDLVTGTMGATEVASTILDVSINHETGWEEFRTLGSGLTFGTVEGGKPDITVELTFLHNASAVAEKALWVAHTPRQLRLKFTGTALTTTNIYTTRQLNCDFVGMWDKFEKLGEQSGLDTVKGTFKVRYNTTAASVGEYLIVNELATLP